MILVGGGQRIKIREQHAQKEEYGEMSGLKWQYFFLTILKFLNLLVLTTLKRICVYLNNILYNPLK